ncbi:ABC-type transport auxiliary lipoprotein family protein [Legionella septentrionalis]|uniref:ABC-type transport auxiliary lipoprotein component domain-containing protein n=1 Tax=Legionella septentrionalis TaxID=2498109 RepID=A0A433JLB7_9GAMM|nr:ABC-type transport auxiliary lipoprotein family protein [Legionella septentrionalis]RUQ90071.1 hypothetical protein EKM59_02750 [Legionella septentrionalis]RUR09363.1 hypothetical protein ELY14_08940 [Legionella septentrionalis]RUR14313.1 hypothetical protein ELY10_09150 [Legionella septentrionalis]
MKKSITIFLICIQVFLLGCAVKTTVNNQYKLDAFSRKMHTTKSATTILVTQPEAAAGYQTEQMLYSVKPYEVSAFARNAWVGAPANMLAPLIMQSLQATGYFHAVTSTPYSDKADYRLDTQLIKLQQNFICKPSHIEMVVKVVLTHVEDNQVLASKIITEKIPCPADTPYGGVIAANHASKALTAILAEFVIAQIKHFKQK